MKKLYLFLVLFLLSATLIIAKDNSKQISFFLHGSSCATCVLGKSSNIITNISKEFSDYSVRFVHTTKDTALITKTKKLLPNSVEYISGDKANLLMTLFAGQNFSYFLVLQDSSLNTLRLTNLDTTYSFLKDKIKTFFSSKDKYTLTKIGDYDLGIPYKSKTYNNNIFLLNTNTDIYHINLNGNYKKLSIYSDEKLKNTVLPKTFLPMLKQMEASGVSSFFPSRILDVSDSTVSFFNYYIDSINIDYTFYNGDSVTTATPVYKVNSLSYNFNSGAFSTNILPKECQDIIFQGFDIYKFNNSFVFCKSVNDIDLQSTELEDFVLVYFTDSNFNIIDSISLYDINRSINVNKFSNFIYYAPLSGDNKHFIYEFVNGMYMIVDSSDAINVNKATTLLLRYSSKDFLNKVFNGTNYKLKESWTGYPVIIGDSIYIFTQAISRDKDYLYISKYNSSGEFQSESMIDIPKLNKIEYFYPFQMDNSFGIYLNYNDDKYSIFKITL